MKKVIFGALGLAVITIASCKKDNFVPANLQKQLILSGTSDPDTLWGTVDSNLTLTRTTYLDGIVYVSPGVTLTVNAGVTIIGAPGPAIPDTVNIRNNKGTLCIQKGAKLNAVGTPTSPIVWTSAQPAGSRHYGDWGGIVLYGKAPIHRA